MLSKQTTEGNKIHGVDYMQAQKHAQVGVKLATL
jgi:hypothetical protein